MSSTATFRRSRHSREPVQVEIITTPAVTSWDASFDDGATWVTGEAVPGAPSNYRWLVAGDAAVLGTAVAQLGAGYWEVLFRATNATHLIVRDLATIEIY